MNIQTKHPQTPRKLGMVFSCAALLLLPALRSPAQTLIAHWDFSTGTTADFTTNGHTLNQVLGTGSTISQSLDAGGYVSLHQNALLVDTSINSTDTAALHNGATFIVTMRYDAVPTTALFNWGLFDATTFTGTTASKVSIGSQYRTDGSGNKKQEVYSSATGTHNALSAGPALPDVGTWFTLTVRFDPTAASGAGRALLYMATNVNGTVTNSTWITSINIKDINSFQSFGIGKLIDSGGVAMSFADVQIYDGVLTESAASALANAAINATTQTAVPEPVTTAVLTAFAAILAACLFRRLRKIGK